MCRFGDGVLLSLVQSAAKMGTARDCVYEFTLPVLVMVPEDLSYPSFPLLIMEVSEWSLAACQFIGTTSYWLWWREQASQELNFIRLACV